MAFRPVSAIRHTTRPLQHTMRAASLSEDEDNELIKQFLESDEEEAEEGDNGSPNWEPDEEEDMAVESPEDSGEEESLPMRLPQ